jgi:hypothetical protein
MHKALSLATASRLNMFCNLPNQARTHAVLMTGLHELVGNPTTHWATRALNTVKFHQCISGRHDIAEILLKVTLNTINQIKSNQIVIYLKKVNILMKLNSIQGPGGSIATSKLYHLRLQVECTFFVIYKAGANPWRMLQCFKVLLQICLPFKNITGSCMSPTTCGMLCPFLLNFVTV